MDQNIFMLFPFDVVLEIIHQLPTFAFIALMRTAKFFRQNTTLIKVAQERKKIATATKKRQVIQVFREPFTLTNVNNIRKHPRKYAHYHQRVCKYFLSIRHHKWTFSILVKLLHNNKKYGKLSRKYHDRRLTKWICKQSKLEQNALTASKRAQYRRSIGYNRNRH
jgi:hypothetical protein